MRIIHVDTEMLRFAYMTDQHLSDQPPGRRTAAYREEIMRKIAFARDFTVKNKAICLSGGDMFHQKRPDARGNTFSLLTQLTYILQGFNLRQVFGVPGNHDLYMDRVDSLPHQPLGTLIAAGAFHNLASESVVFENQDGTLRIQVDGCPYTSDDLAALAGVMNVAPREPGVDYRIVLMHQYGNPGDDPSLFGHPTIGFNNMAMSDYDFALWGHDHSRTEVVTVGKCTHIRLGSLSRASLAEDECDRPVNLAVLSFKGKKVGFKEVTVPTQPLEIAFTTAAGGVEKVRDSDEIQEYFRKMDDTVGGIESTDPNEVMVELATTDGVVDKQALDEARDCCGGL